MNEPKVYVLDAKEVWDFRDLEHKGDFDKIMSKAEELGTVYSLQGFQDAVNDEELNLNNSFIYISNKPEVRT